MKKILFAMAALICSMSMNAQVLKIMKDGEVIMEYKTADYDMVIFEEETMAVDKDTTDIEEDSYINSARKKFKFTGPAYFEGLEKIDKSDNYKYMDRDSVKSTILVAYIYAQESLNNDVATIFISDIKVGGRKLTRLKVRIGIKDGVLEDDRKYGYSCTRQYGETIEDVSVIDDGTANDNSSSYYLSLHSGKVEGYSGVYSFTFEATVYMGNETYNITYYGTAIKESDVTDEM